MNKTKSLLSCTVLVLSVVSCDTERSPPTADLEAPDVSATDLVWAVNVGGPAYTGIDGTEFLAEESVTGGEIGTMKTVKGSQDAFLYKSYREGDIRVAHPLPDGTYDITFHFAEPKDYAGSVNASSTPSPKTSESSMISMSCSSGMARSSPR